MPAAGRPSFPRMTHLSRVAQRRFRIAVYSNFASKDELIIVMHGPRGAPARHHRELLAHHRDPVDFGVALRVSDCGPPRLAGRASLLPWS